MDTLKAAKMGWLYKDSPMTNFDADEIKQKMEEHQVEEAEIFLARDRGFTNTVVRIINGKVHGCYMGTSGSTWARPMLDINDNIYEVGTDEECKIIWDLDYEGKIVNHDQKS